MLDMMAGIGMYYVCTKPCQRSMGPIPPLSTFGFRPMAWEKRKQRIAFCLTKDNAQLSDLLVNPWLIKSKRVFSSGGARTHTSREMKNFSPLLYQLSYQGLMLVEAIVLIYILIPKFLIIFHHYLIFLETRPSWKGQ